jgi:hypothetical protein
MDVEPNPKNPTLKMSRRWGSWLFDTLSFPPISPYIITQVTIANLTTEKTKIYPYFKVSQRFTSTVK